MGCGSKGATIVTGALAKASAFGKAGAGVGRAGKITGSMGRVGRARNEDVTDGVHKVLFFKINFIGNCDSLGAGVIKAISSWLQRIANKYQWLCFAVQFVAKLSRDVMPSMCCKCLKMTHIGNLLCPPFKKRHVATMLIGSSI
jgi:hypothetical protein